MTFTLITITADELRPDLDAATGTVTATLSEQIQNGTEIVDPTPITGILAPGGLFDDSGIQPFKLAPNDTPGTSPMGSTYELVIESDSAPLRSGTVNVPYNAAGLTIDLSVLLPSP